MPDVLSQEEVDSLLSGMSSGKVETAVAPGKHPDPIVFDFRLPHRLSKSQLRAFRSVHENFGDSFASYLASRLQTTVSMRVIAIEQIFYSDHVHAIGNPNCLYVFRIKESNALAVLEFQSSLILSMVGHLMGGSEAEENTSRPITRIEQNVVRTVIHRSINDLQRAWKTATELTFVFERYESEGELMQLAPASEIVMVVAFEVTVGTAKHTLNACFPISGIEAVLAQINAQSHAAPRKTQGDSAWSKPLLRQLEGTRIPVAAKIGESLLTVRELLSLERGDILRTRVPVDSEIVVIVGGAARFAGRPGISRGNLAVKVSRAISEQSAGE